MQAKLGDIITTKRHGYMGKVYRKDHYFEGDSAWFNAQKPKLAAAVKNENWYHILCNAGGSIYTFESDISGILPVDTPFEHPYNDFYFNND